MCRQATSGISPHPCALSTPAAPSCCSHRILASWRSPAAAFLDMNTQGKQRSPLGKALPGALRAGRPVRLTRRGSELLPQLVQLLADRQPAQVLLDEKRYLHALQVLRRFGAWVCACCTNPCSVCTRIQCAQECGSLSKEQTHSKTSEALTCLPRRCSCNTRAVKLSVDAHR